jgi:hypothetical protein
MLFYDHILAGIKGDINNSDVVDQRHILSIVIPLAWMFQMLAYNSTDSDDNIAHGYMDQVS